MFVFLQQVFPMHIDRISCDVQVDEEQMCGKTFTLMGNFEKHTDIFHPACCKLSGKDFGWC